MRFGHGCCKKVEFPVSWRRDKGTPPGLRALEAQAPPVCKQNSVKSKPRDTQKALHPYGRLKLPLDLCSQDGNGPVQRKVEILVKELFNDDKLGVRLRMEGLVVSNFDVPEAGVVLV